MCLHTGHYYVLSTAAISRGAIPPLTRNASYEDTEAVCHTLGYAAAIDGGDSMPVTPELRPPPRLPRELIGAAPQPPLLPGELLPVLPSSGTPPSIRRAPLHIARTRLVVWQCLRSFRVCVFVQPICVFLPARARTSSMG